MKTAGHLAPTNSLCSLTITHQAYLHRHEAETSASLDHQITLPWVMPRPQQNARAASATRRRNNRQAHAAML